MSEQITKDLGGITAYAAAVSAGYTGTKAQFETLMASYATVAQNAAASATAANGSAEDAEAYAVGTRDGSDVGSTDPAYHNNSKYYAELAEDYADSIDPQKFVDIENTLIYGSNITQGYYAIADGTPTYSATWCKSEGFISNDIVLRIGDAFRLCLMAFETDGSYVGTWTGSGYSKTYDYSTMLYSSINVDEIAKAYPHYLFKLLVYSNTGSAITPTDVDGSLVAERSFFGNSANITQVQKKVFFPVKIGETFVISSSDGQVLPAGGQLRLFNSYGSNISYFNFGTNPTRTITSDYNFTYVDVSNIEAVNINVKNLSKPFGQNLFSEILNEIGDLADKIFNA